MHRIKTALLLSAVAAFSLSSCTMPSSGADDWSSYPAAAGIPVEDVLAAPSEADIEAHAQEVMSAVMAELEAEHGVTGWEVRAEAMLAPYGANGYGGESMLLSYTAPVWQSNTAVPRDDWDDVIASAIEVGAGFQMTSEGGASNSAWRSQVTLANGTSYLDVLVVDVTDDEYQREEYEANGEATQGVSLVFGAVVIPDAERAAFEAAAEPFIGQPLPVAE